MQVGPRLQPKHFLKCSREEPRHSARTRTCQWIKPPPYQLHLLLASPDHSDGTSQVAHDLRFKVAVSWIPYFRNIHSETSTNNLDRPDRIPDDLASIGHRNTPL